MGITGEMTLTDGIHRIGGVSLKLRSVERGILKKLLVPVMNESEVGEEEATKDTNMGLYMSACLSRSLAAVYACVCLWLWWCSVWYRRVWRQGGWHAWIMSRSCCERRSRVRERCHWKAVACVGV